MKELNYDSMTHEDLKENLTEAFNTAFADDDIPAEQMQRAKTMIEQISTFYLRKQEAAQKAQRAKEKRRKNSKIQKKSRSVNRKK